jgi:uncharacterized protein YndB with AHSA1/START domain
LASDILGRVKRSIEIKVPPAKVWEMLAFDRLLEWEEGDQKDIESVEYTSDVSTLEDKYEVGATAHFLDKHDRLKYACEITENIENEKISSRWRGTGMVRNTIVTYTLKPTEAGTEMTYVVDYEMPWGIFGTFLDKLFAQRMAEKANERELENLKHILEK